MIVERLRVVPITVAFWAMMGVATSAQNLGLPALPAETAAEFPAIGRLGQAGFRERQGCTATLIAPDLIVTAGHCTAQSGESDHVFAAGWFRGVFVAERGTAREMRHPAYAVDGEHDPRNDVGLIVLDAPIENVVPIPLGQTDAGDLYGTDVALVGYHRFQPEILSGNLACPAKRFGEGLMRVGCRVTGGNSGGPILNRTQTGDWQVVGIVSSQFEASAIAVEIPDWLRREIDKHLSQ